MDNILRIIPGVNTWEALSGFRRAGFLHYIGELWQKYGDVFQVKVFNRRMVVALHPDAVRHVGGTLGTSNGFPMIIERRS